MFDLSRNVILCFDQGAVYGWRPAPEKKPVISQYSCNTMSLQGQFADLPAALDSILSDTRKSYRNKCYAVDVVLSDPFAKYVYLQFESLPGSQRKVMQLIQTRMAKEYLLDEKDYRFQINRFANSNNKSQLGVFAIKLDLASLIEGHAGRHGGVLRGISIVYQHIHNALDKKFRGFNAIYLHYSDLTWTVSCIEEGERIVYFKSRHVQAHAAPVHEILTEIGTAVNQAVRLLSGNSPLKLYYYNTATNDGSVADLLHELQAMNPGDVTAELRSMNKSLLMSHFFNRVC